ncbi:MAG: hypothetical protein J6B87_06395 [Clostridia bacterium]|nr:hypothetical protein [Clostridia bacterium]
MFKKVYESYLRVKARNADLSDAEVRQVVADVLDIDVEDVECAIEAHEAGEDAGTRWLRENDPNYGL